MVWGPCFLPGGKAVFNPAVLAPMCSLTGAFLHEKSRFGKKNDQIGQDYYSSADY
jgi:hypothetical protein